MNYLTFYFLVSIFFSVFCPVLKPGPENHRVLWVLSFKQSCWRTPFQLIFQPCGGVNGIQGPLGSVAVRIQKLGRHGPARNKTGYFGVYLLRATIVLLKIQQDAGEQLMLCLGVGDWAGWSCLLLIWMYCRVPGWTPQGHIDAERHRPWGVRVLQEAAPGLCPQPSPHHPGPSSLFQQS